MKIGINGILRNKGERMDNLINAAEFYRQKLKETDQEIYRLSQKEKREIEKIKIIDQKGGKSWMSYHGDAVEVIKGIPDNSIHYSIFSPPFSSLFTYSASIRDLGNSSDDEFYDHFSFIVPELYRVIMPGRLLSFHCSDIPAMISRDGYMGLKDFPGIVLRIFEKAGFIYHSKVQIKKNELMEAQRTKALGLAHKQVVKDSSRCRNALPDYIITVIKPGENKEPISRPMGFEEYIGEGGEPESDRKKHADPRLNRYSQRVWQRYASSIWMDIHQGDTLNVKLSREKDDERHICPLQLDAIARCLELWTNKGDIVLSPFMGIGSEGYEALKMGRKFIGIELKKSYFDISVKNLESIEKRSISAKGFFD